MKVLHALLKNGICCILIISLAVGCGKSNSTTIAPSPLHQSVKNEQKEMVVKVYGTDNEAANLVERQIKITYEDELQAVEQIIKALKDEREGDYVSLWKNIDFNSITLQDSNVMIDIHIDDSDRVGSLIEQYMVDSLSSSLFQLSFVNAITFLVDGKEMDSLMGHVDISEGIHKNNE